MSRTDKQFGRRALLLASVGAAVAGPVEQAVARAVRTGRTTALARSFGAFEVMPLVDASGPFFLGRQAAFPEATSHDWDVARLVDPSAFGLGETWLLDFRCFVIRGPRDRLLLVDTGVGPDGSPAAAWAPTPGRLPAELELAGIDPRDVDTVVLTHLHEDHYGWSVGLDGTPVFANARYIVQRREVAALAEGDAAVGYVVDPLRATGQLDQVSGAARVTLATGRSGGSIRVVPTPGHTPGHQSVVIDSRDRQVIVTGDVLVHAVQLVDPDVSYRFEADPEVARRTRHTLLIGARQRHTVLATAHLRQPFIELD